MRNLSDRQLSGIFFCIALAAALLAMIFSPLKLDALSVAAAVVAIVVSLGGIYLAAVSKRADAPGGEDPPPPPGGNMPKPKS